MLLTQYKFRFEKNISNDRNMKGIKSKQKLR